MRRILRLLVGILAATLVCGVASAQEPVLFGYPLPISRTASTSGGHDSRTDLMTDGQGTWVAVWYSSDSLGATIGWDYDILVARSTNDGITWTPPAALNTNAGSDAGNDYRPQVATDGQGTWVVVWNSWDSLGGTIATDGDILVARSTDGGATWTAPAALNTNAASDSGEDISPQLATDGQGNWVAVWQSDDSLGGTIGGDNDILVAHSADGGATWTPPANLSRRSNSYSDEDPQLATDRQGNWVVVFDSERSGDDADIRVARSTDAGATWTTARLHPSNSAWDWFAHVTTDGLGNWVAVWTVSKPAESSGNFPDPDIRVARSTNAGATWSSPKQLHPNNSGDDWHAKVTTDGQGNWVTVWHSDISADRHVHVSRSIDAGATWTAPVALNPNAATNSGRDDHPQVTTDRRGIWLAVWRSEDSLRGTIGPDRDVLLARSTDGGASWSAPGALNGNAYTGSGHDSAARVTTDGLGTWVTVWDSIDSLDGSIGMDSNILVSRSTDGGHTWSGPARLDPGSGSDSGDDLVAQVTTDGRGTWVAVWHSFDDLGGTIGTDSDILVSRSTDRGATWSAAAPLHPNASSDSGDDLFPQLTNDGQGTWVAVWHSFDALGDTIGTDGDILLSASTDGGLTWSEAVALDPNAGSDAGNDIAPQLTTDGQGTWIAVWHSFDELGNTIGTDGDILLSRSTNAAVTWSAATALDPRAGSDSGDDAFAQLTTDGLGTWVAVWQSFDNLRATVGRDGDILLSRSTDGGVTWSPPGALNSNAGADSGDDLLPQLTTDGQGTWIAVWHSFDKLTITVGTDGDILAARSTDGGVTWSAPSALDPNARVDAGEDIAPQVATDGWGTWVAVWESADALTGDNDILAAVLDPSVYQDTDSSGSFDPGEERAGGVGGNGGSGFDYAFDLEASTHDLNLTSIELVLASYNHAFRIDINGVTVVPLDPGNPAVFTPSLDAPQNPNENRLPRLRIVLTEASIEFSGSESKASTEVTVPVVYDQPTTNPIFVDGQNTVAIENPNGSGSDAIDFRIRLRGGELPYQKISDSHGSFEGALEDGDGLGRSLASLGDLDGDGVGDLAVGAYLDDDGGTNRGAVWILFLDTAVTVKSQQKISDTQGGFTGALDDEDEFGKATDSLGDLDGDGVGDLAVGGTGDDDGGPDRGAVWILFLDTDGMVESHQKISSTQGNFTGVLRDGDFFGNSVASLDDLDGDGVSDLAVGARSDDDGGAGRGAVWILFLNADGTVKSHQKISSTQGGFTGTLDDEDGFGVGLDFLGDLDGDGVGDLAVGARFDGDGGAGHGAVWILFLDKDGKVKSHQKISSTQGGFTGTFDDWDAIGFGLASLGDLDGDGVGDLAVGAIGDDDGGDGRGAVWILFLDTDGKVKSHQKISSTQGGFTGTLDNGDVFGFGLEFVGDLDGDGVGDLAVGAIGDDDGGPSRGAVWILFLDGAFCSDGVRHALEECDDGNVVAGDGCDPVCRIEPQDSWQLSGLAAGGTISFRVDGVPLQVVTSANETAEEVAASVADAINADPSLSTTGVFAFASESTVISNHVISDRRVDDLGLKPRFGGLGDLPGGEFSSAAHAVSADGAVAVGRSDSGGRFDDEAFRWEAGVMTGLGGFQAAGSGGACTAMSPPLFPCASVAEDVSADGSVVVGWSGSFPFRWEDGVMAHIPCDRRLGAPDGPSTGYAFAVSDDGSVVVGEPAFSWTGADGCEFLGTLSVSESARSSAEGVSADGWVIVGQSDSELGPIVNPPGCVALREVREAFRWEVNGCDPDGLDNPCMVGLGDLPGGAIQSLATDVSADGSVVVGASQSDLCNEAFRWDWEDGVMKGLGTLPSLGITSIALAVSADGSVIVGYVGASSIFGPSVGAFIWDETHGMRSLQDVLVANMRLDLTGWTLTSATGISADGSTIVGEGINPVGFNEGWIAVLPIPEPAMEWLGVAAITSLAYFARRRRA